MRLVNRNRIVSTRLPFAARGLSRRALDEALLRQAQARGATVLRGHRVSAIRQDGGSLRLDCGSLGSVVADSVFLATGKHELRGARRTGHDSGLVGLKMYYALATSQLEAARRTILALRQAERRQSASQRPAA